MPNSSKSAYGYTLSVYGKQGEERGRPVDYFSVVQGVVFWSGGCPLEDFLCCRLAVTPASNPRVDHISSHWYSIVADVGPDWLTFLLATGTGFGSKTAAERKLVRRMTEATGPTRCGLTDSGSDCLSLLLRSGVRAGGKYGGMSTITVGTVLVRDGAVGVLFAGRMLAITVGTVLVRDGAMGVLFAGGMLTITVGMVIVRDGAAGVLFAGKVASPVAMAPGANPMGRFASIRSV